MIRAIALMLLGFSLLPLASSQAAGPAQYIAKMYTQVLGRAPDPVSWNGALSYFKPVACNRTTLSDWGFP